ncbi:MAG: tRNA (guanosine(46)-N7)-methyltransferase TrmB [Alphaproteobacteria bacterium]|nr:tRNA (guanosine(46)-N7)-methyltransferase TrmB [Alphaproteobacteria bacterium]MBV8548225.1 tRNA (guanosine(46)-N7)-methyltransferase TrmB [Alphaproteobacteria bacterium]
MTEQEEKKKKNYKPVETRLFGRRKGRPLRIRKTRLMQELLPQLTITLDADKNAKYPNWPTELFPHKPQSVWLEVGFGGGEHLAGQAALNPAVGVIGCEPFINGVASLLEHVEDTRLNNVRIYPDDARVLIDALPDACLSRCFVLFADPWPKARHAERRFIRPDNIARLARVIKPGGELRLASDAAGLVTWMREQMAQASDLFTCLHDSATPPADWVPTRYEQKGIAAGRVPYYLLFVRK